MRESSNKEFMKMLSKVNKQLIISIEKSTKIDKELPKNKIKALTYLLKAIEELKK